MTKDYKKNHSSDNQGNGGYAWMLSGIALGLLIGLGMYFYSTYQTKLQGNSGTNPQQAEAGNTPNAASDADSATDSESLGIQEPDPISAVIEKSRQEQQEENRASFSYYAVLPNLELDVNVRPEEAEQTEELAEEPAATTPITAIPQLLPGGSYLLQLASFKTIEQAQSAQGKLQKKGLEVTIEKRNIKGKDWYRIYLGPTLDDAQLSGWKAAAEQAGYKPLIVKAP